MQSKVLLFDASNVKIGETFMRRARQLVKQQRAEWVDDSKSAVRFVPDLEVWGLADDNHEVSSSISTHDFQDDDWIAILLEKQLTERRRIKIHSLALLVWFLGLFVLRTVLWSYLTYVMPNRAWALEQHVGLLSILWLIAYIIHVFLYIRSFHWNYDKLVCRVKQLATEAANK